MRLAELVFLVTYVALTNAVQRGEDGRLYENFSDRLFVGAPPKEIKSLEYPTPSPKELVQSWRYVGEENKNAAIKIICNHISIEKDGSGCGYNGGFFTVDDGSDNKEYCGELSPFTIVTKNNDVKMRFYSGKKGGGIVSCTVQNLYIDANGNEVTVVTTTAPEPSPWTTPRPPGTPLNQYRFLPSEEIDSSEHGGEEGGKSTSCPCGWANKVASRIVNGAETAKNEFPFAAALVDAENKGQLCGATIITEYHAITAAHCTAGSFKYNYSLAIIVGVHKLYQDLKPPGEVINVEKIIQHEGYTGTPYFKHDISLLILQSKITFGPLVGPACLPTHLVQLDRQYIKIVGWGNLYWRGPGSDVLKKVDVRVVPMDECHFEYYQVDPVNPTQICTFAKRGASCQGDSGGPVIWLDPETNRYTVVGAVSYGANCGLRPTVHTAIGYYLDWIRYFIQASRKGGQICQKME